MKRGIRLAAAAAAFAALPVLSAEAQTLRMMTGPQGGVWVPIAGALKNIWEQNISGVAIQTLPGAGVANVRGIDEGRAELGFGNSITTVDGLNGEAPFPRKVTKVCNLGNLYPQYFQVVTVADANITRIADLRGKSIAIQPRGNTAEVVTQHILRAAGMSYSDVRANFQASYTDAVGLLKDGHAVAFTLGTTIPASSVMDLASARQIRFVDLTPYAEAMKKINAGYNLGPIPANTYPQQTAPVPQIVYSAHLIASCEQPEERVYRMVQLMFANLNALTPINRAMQGLTPAAAAEDIGVPMHPGAARFYREQGARG
ncbi:TAXI family TRAP transporter solute-binding subunit [Elioraea rosea]|uniref:TAXI family TRAP transporter solute-binding subunit n=1 Tax=Elioraea rosea TaxID=2492390 RepID=UPI0011830A3A|nr:TAXI family TRAP transporter solute-binding subunit [Elioraea rosea]